MPALLIGWRMSLAAACLISPLIICNRHTPINQIFQMFYGKIAQKSVLLISDIVNNAVLIDSRDGVTKKFQMSPMACRCGGIMLLINGVVNNAVLHCSSDVRLTLRQIVYILHFSCRLGAALRRVFCSQLSGGLTTNLARCMHESSVQERWSPWLPIIVGQCPGESWRNRQRFYL